MKRIISLFSMVILATGSSFGLTISELKSLIDKNSLDLSIGRFSVEKSELLEKSTFRSYFPKVSLTGEVDEFYPYTSFSSKSWNQQYSLGVSITANPLNLQRNLQLKVDRYSIDVNREQLEKTRLNLYYQGINYLLKLKALERIVEIRRELLKNSEKILNVSEEKYKKGLVLITDVLKSKANVENARSSLRKAERDYNQTFNNLNELVNFSLSENEKPEVELFEAVKLPEVEKLVKRALSTRPEICALRKEIEVTKLNVKIEQRTLSPQLNLSASYTRSDTKVFPENNNYRFSAVLNFPVFDSGVTKFKSLAAEKDLVSKEISLRKQENAIKREVLNAVESVNSALEEVKSSKSFLEYSKRAYERTFNEYKLGVSDIVALLQAFDNLKNAEESYINSLLSLNSAYYELKRATGELLSGSNR